jgi:hypothetical protein
MLYKCEKCNKEFATKQSYEKHLQRKSECSLETKLKLEKKEFFCNFCNQGFTEKKNLLRHLKNNICSAYDEITLTKSELINIYQKVNKSVPDEITNNNNKNTINKSVLGNKNNVNNNSNNNSLSYVENNQNIQIMVNPFGKESQLPVPAKVYFEAMKNLIKGIPLLVKYIHYNYDHPENMNIEGKGISSKYLVVYDGKDWNLANKKNIIHNLITDKKDQIDDFFDEQVENNKISKQMVKRYETQTEKLDEVLNKDFRGVKPSEESTELYKELEEEMNLLLENEKNKKKKYEEQQSKKIINKKNIKKL